jgi:hypothetical protein
MHRVLVVASFAVFAQGGTIQGIVLEHASGRPVARTVVRLDPVPQAGGGGAKGQPLSTRAGRTGQFAFLDISPGLYLLHAVRDGYLEAANGQRLPTGRGTPIEVTADSKLFAELRLRHKGALTGRVLDENGVAAAGIPVLAYGERLPLRSAGSAVSDDRGVYRIHGLEPGRYWVRSGAYTLDDGSGWLPTFGQQGRETGDARVHRVTVDADTPDADIYPEPGALFHLSGVIACDRDAVVVVTLSSETGRRSTQTACKNRYQFDGLAPAAYEVLATTQDNAASGFIELFLDRDSDSGNVQVLQVPTVAIEVRRAGSNTLVNTPVTLIGRRQDLSETEVSRDIKGPRTTLAPGNWEFRAHAPAGQYVESITGFPGAPRRPWKAARVSDWYEAFIEPRFPSTIRITVSDKAGQITGSVMTEGKPVPGAPVFLWPVDESTRRSLSGPLQALSNTEGRFRFDGLPPGDYRPLASFDVNEIDEELIEMSRAPVAHVEATQTATIELPVWVAP